MQLNKDSREFIELLNSNAVEYLVVGGFAVAWHGYPRFTAGIDFLIRADQPNAEHVLRVLRHFGFGSLGIVAEDLSKPDQIIQLGTKPNRIDLITSNIWSPLRRGVGSACSRYDRWNSSQLHWTGGTGSQQNIDRPARRCQRY